MSGKLLDISGLSVAFRTRRGPLRALRNVSLGVGKGEIVGIIGESGCGKSTLINSIIGLLPANAEKPTGQIRFADEEIVGMPQGRLQQLRGERITTIFQDPMTALNPVLSIGTQMTAIQYRRAGNTAQKRRRAIEFLEKVRVPDARSRLDQYPHQFSGGMRQRICIAMALLTEPDLLIADEPTTALDATLEVQVIRLIRELQRDIGCSVLFISHHLGAVAELCERVAIMYAGEVVEQGPVRDIFHDPRHPYTRKLLECDPGRVLEPLPRLPTIGGELPDLVRLPQGCIFEARCPDRFARCRVRPPVETVRPGHDAACYKARELVNP
ncbi:ABC transporter ATP-binding protein [Taklimakanibacter deserti]|uniref:ABC transporter ATP-binding protein n=1 Tax=Taklimakanibacter deserti TaxID=2267839 RepID=UPI000E65018C